MPQPDSQQIQALLAPSVGAASGGASVSAPSMRTVALSLLVDRALSA